MRTIETIKQLVNCREPSKTRVILHLHAPALRTSSLGTNSRKYFSATGKEQLSLASFQMFLKNSGQEVDAHQLTQKVTKGLFHSNLTRLPLTVHYTLYPLYHCSC